MKTSHTYTLNTASTFEHLIDLLAGAWRRRWEDGRTPDLDVTVKLHEENRSAKQNARYWALLNLIAQEMPSHMDGAYHDPEVWHEYFKRRILGVEVVDIRGEPTPVTKSTRRLNVEDFQDYMQQVEALAAEDGIFLGDL